MIDSGIKKAVLCSILGTAVMAVSICADSQYEKNNATVVNNVSSETTHDGWRAETGRYVITSETSQATGSENSDIFSSADTSASSSYEISETSETITEKITDVPAVSSAVISDTTSSSSTIAESTVSSDETSEISVSESITPVTETPPANISNPLPASEKQDMSFLNDAVFVGDSIMEGMSAYSFFPENQVFASVGLNPYQLNTNTIDTYYGNVTALSAVLSANPDKIYIMMGMNGVAWDMNNNMTEQIGIFIDEIIKNLPSAKIYLMTVTPVSAEREAKPSAAEGKILNSQIDDFNSSLLNLANEKGIYFLDVNSSLKGSNGCLPSNVSSDGIHLSKAVYQDIIDYILTHTAK